MDDHVLHGIQQNTTTYLCPTGSISVQKLCNALKANTSVTHLKLNNQTQIDTESAPSLAEVLKVNTTLLQLYICNYTLDDNGWRSIADALKDNTTLESLRLDQDTSSFTLEAYKSIAGVLEVNTTLNELVFFDTIGLSSEGTHYLLNAMRVNRSIQKLHLATFPKDLRLFQQLTDMIRVNRMLSGLDVWYTYGGYSKDEAQLMTEAAWVNPTLVLWHAYAYSGACYQTNTIDVYTDRNLHNLAQKRHTLAKLLRRWVAKS